MSGDLLFPAAGRVVAIDNGRKRIGVAICDAQRIIPTPCACIGQPVMPLLKPRFVVSL